MQDTYEPRHAEMRGVARRRGSAIQLCAGSEPLYMLSDGHADRRMSQNMPMPGITCAVLNQIQRLWHCRRSNRRVLCLSSIQSRYQPSERHQLAHRENLDPAGKVYPQPWPGPGLALASPGQGQGCPGLGYAQPWPGPGTGYARPGQGQGCPGLAFGRLCACKIS